MHTFDRQTDRYRQQELTSNIIIITSSQLSQRDPAAGWVSFGQKWKTGTGRQYSTDIIGISSTTVT